MKSRRGKRIIWLLACLLLLPACGKKEEADSPYSIYYVNRDDTKVLSKPYEPEGQEARDLVNEFIAALETAPEDVSLKPAIGSTVNILQYEYNDEVQQVIIYFDDHYKELEPACEVLSRAAIVRTLTQIPGVDYVTFYIKDEPMKDRQGTAIGNMTADMFIDSTGDEINAYEKVSLQLYFANETGDKLIPVKADDVIYNSNIPLERQVVESIIAGPPGREGKAVVSPATKVNSVSTRDGVCYVNLNAEFLNSVDNVTEEVVLYAFVNSLSEMPNINKVQFSVDGATDRNYREKLPLSSFYERNLEIISTGEDAFE